MNKTRPTYNLEKVLELGEGQFIEFKELPDKSLPKELVAFANASGGIIYLGISDTGKIKGIKTTNKLKSVQARFLRFFRWTRKDLKIPLQI